MLPQFALINMNGRMYDPVIGKMLAPDINIPDPYSAAGYNRYSYAFDNPLSNVDPSGWLSDAAIQDIFNELNNNSDPYGGYYTPGKTPGDGSGGSWTSFGSVGKAEGYMDMQQASASFDPYIWGSGISSNGLGRPYTMRELNAINRYYSSILNFDVNSSFGLLNGFNLNVDNNYNTGGINIGWSLNYTFAEDHDDVYVHSMHLSDEQADNLLRSLGFDEPESPIIKVADYMDKGMVSTDVMLQGAQRLSNVLSPKKNPIIPLEKLPILGVIAKVATGVVAGHQIYEGFQNHDYIEAAEGVGTVVVEVLFPEVSIPWAILTYGIDIIREKN